MTRRFVITFALICFALLTFGSLWAQNKPAKLKPDLSGTWLLDVKKSNSVGLTSRPDLPIKIAHHDPEFRVTLTSESKGHLVDRDFLYFTDGRGEENAATSFLTTNPSVKPTSHQNERTNSKTRWSGNKIVTRSILRLTAGGRMIEFELVDEWKLSSDGKRLTQTTSTVFLQSSSAGVFVPAMTPDKKRVYNRV